MSEAKWAKIYLPAKKTREYSNQCGRKIFDVSHVAAKFDKNQQKNTKQTALINVKNADHK